MPPAAAKKLMNKVNPGDTGLMHGLLLIHVGMRVRLLDHIDKAKGLVKDAEGDVERTRWTVLVARDAPLTCGTFRLASG